MADKILHSSEYLRKRLAYDPFSGALTWRHVSPCGFLTPKACAIINKKYAGKTAGTAVNQWGYYIIGIRPKVYLAHRVVWAIHYGAWPDGEIDHIDGDKLNNKIENLRVVDGATNRRNMPTQKNNTSGHAGISVKNGKWIARIGGGQRGKRIYLGTFQTLGEAVAARKAAEQKFGYHEGHGR